MLPDAPDWLPDRLRRRPAAARSGDRVVAAAAAPAASRGDRPSVRQWRGHRHDVTTARNLRKLADAAELLGAPLPRSFARPCSIGAATMTLDKWLDALPAEVSGRRSAESMLEPTANRPPRRRGARVPDSLTFARTARRSFEVAYWKTIAALAEGTFLNKNNADCVRRRDHAAHAALSRTAPGAARRLPARRTTADAIRAAGHDRQGPGGRGAVPLADRLRLPLDGRLAEEPGRPRPSATCSS